MVAQPAALDDAWAYFRSFTLPRRIKDDGGKFRLAEPGEEGGEIYSVWGSSVKDMGDFGLGIGLYFTTLMEMSALMFVCGLILLPSMMYFDSDNYDPNRTGDIDWRLKGSAICNASLALVDNGEELEMVQRNECNVKNYQGILDIVVMCLLASFCIATAKVQDKLVEMLDEAQQTTQDYAVVVEDPGPDDVDPDKWRDHFSQFGEVAYVTVAKNNGPLLRAMATRRFVDKMLHYEDIKDGKEDDDGEISSVHFSPPLPLHKQILQKIGFSRDLVFWQKARNDINAKVAELLRQPYHAVQVFIIFNTEEAQRECLKVMTTGLIPAMTDTATIDDKYRFDGNVLKVSEPVEPSEVLWENLHITLKQRAIEAVFTLFLTFSLLVAAFFTIEAASSSGSGLGAIIISGINVCLPLILKIITSFESHVDAGNMQESLLLKLVVARMMTTAVMIHALTPFEDRLEEATLVQVQAILIADAITAPAIRFFDIGGKLKRNVLAKSALTQDKMNSFFAGTKWNLAERYTDMTKTVFVSLFYAAVLPSGIFISAFAFFVNYWVDKYCLLRQWETPPALDDSLATTSRSHIVFCVFIHLLITANYYAGWSFDEVCERTITFEDDDYSYTELYKCDKVPSNLLLPTSESWMGSTQSKLVDVYGVATLTCFIFLLVFYFGKSSYEAFLGLWKGQYSAVGDVQGINYSSVHNIHAFVPQIKRVGLQLPLLACDLSLLDRDHINWTGDFDANNLFMDDSGSVELQVIETDVEQGRAATKTGAAGGAAYKAAPPAPTATSAEERRRVFSICKCYIAHAHDEEGKGKAVEVTSPLVAGGAAAAALQAQDDKEDEVAAPAPTTAAAAPAPTTTIAAAAAATAPEEGSSADTADVQLVVDGEQ